MPVASRDRVTIDLRGIGDAVRAAAACRGMGAAQFVRRGLVMSLDLRATAPVAPVNGGSDGQTPDQIPIRETAKLTPRLPKAHADALMLNAGALGLSYGDYVGRLMAGSRLPQPVARCQADRAALLASIDRMAALSTDLVALVTLLRQAKVKQARPYRDRLEAADAGIRRHFDRASALIDPLRGRLTMSSTIDGLLVQWGDRLFYPSNRITASRTPVQSDAAVRQRAQILRQRIHATVERRAPQVLVKVSDGGRGMGAIAEHPRYIAKPGRLPIADGRGVLRGGREALRAIADQWRLRGTRIPEVSQRLEAFNIMLSMPIGTDARVVRKAAREFAKAELAYHRYVMVLPTHQANPHVHISVGAESRDGKRLNPRKEDLHRWRENFAEKLRGWGIEAEAWSQATRGVSRRSLRGWERQPGTAARTSKRCGEHKSELAFRATRSSTLL